MGAQNRQWILLDECINAYLDESEQGNHKYFKCWNLAFRAMTELGLDFFYTVKSVKLPVNPNLTVSLPEDYISYTKIGVLNNQGEIIPLISNSTLTTAFDLQPSRVEQTDDPSIVTGYSPQGIVWWNFWNGYGLSNLYGLPSGSPFVGSYKIDNQNGLIVLDQYFQFEYVMLEYLSSPKQGAELYVPIQFKEAVIAYLRWKDLISMPTSRKGSLGDKRDRRADYYNERRLSIARYDAVNLSDLYEWNLRNQRITVKG
jgi:hypothetical protein|tara:strand:+ start:5529 stop:6299 length:771 start_codon:yes stop_codon:yes gene_type:complete